MTTEEHVLVLEATCNVYSDQQNTMENSVQLHRQRRASAADIGEVSKLRQEVADLWRVMNHRSRITFPDHRSYPLLRSKSGPKGKLEMEESRAVAKEGNT